MSILKVVHALIFFPESTEVRARSTSDLFSPAPRLYGKSLGAHRVDIERRHLLLTQYAQQGQGRVDALAACRGERRRERRSCLCQRHIECGRHALGDCFPYVLYRCFV